MPNRSMPPGTIIPVLAYPDAQEAAQWLCRAFGFRMRLIIGNHRIQLQYGEGSLVVTDGGGAGSPGTGSIMISVNGLDAHYANALQNGARIAQEPADHVYGERQYTALDPQGYRWTFSQSIADIDPLQWGGQWAGEVD